MIKYLLLALLIIWFVYASPWKRVRPGNRQQKAQTPSAPPPPQQMVACAHCGVHLPVADALPARQATGMLSYFCSEGHRLAGPRGHQP